MEGTEEKKTKNKLTIVDLLQHFLVFCLTYLLLLLVIYLAAWLTGCLACFEREFVVYSLILWFLVFIVLYYLKKCCDEMMNK